MPTDNTQEHRNYALNKLAEEDREMAKSEAILTSHRRWIVEECSGQEQCGTLYFDGREAVFVRVVRKLEIHAED